MIGEEPIRRLVTNQLSKANLDVVGNQSYDWLLTNAEQATPPNCAVRSGKPLSILFVISRAVESDSHQEVNSLLTEETCYDNWIEYGDYCFKAYSRVYEEKLNWYGARSFCRGMGADLASFHSQAEEQQVIQQTNKYYETYWYGLNDIDQEGTYQWSDGSTVTYTNWVYGSPPYDYDGTSDCVSYYWQTYNSYYNGWDTQNCDLAKNSWVCKVAKGVELTTPTPPPPPNYCHEDNTGTDWLEYNGMCYYYSDLSGTDESSWTEAREFCNSQGGELASIHSDNETDWMSAQV
uniref:Macrophage mannose receptor 1-like n=1 Tax=Saccoglossus kowalevskii TaxID=10224 RepID=A0ABM0M775_SACKO|nr:PREDICTED: macrophage mannose receptor 1-like [Saccoglossus kowalevskii]